MRCNMEQPVQARGSGKGYKVTGTPWGMGRTRVFVFPDGMGDDVRSNVSFFERMPPFENSHDFPRW